MTDISVFTDDELSGIGIGPEHGVAMSRINELITKVNGMDTPAEIAYTPTTSADWPGTDPTTVQGALDNLANFQSADVVAVCAGLDLMQDAGEKVSAALNGNSAKNFIPTEVLILATALTGSDPDGGALKIGTTDGGTQILGATNVHTIAAEGGSLRIPISTVMPAIAGNATMYLESTTKETTSTTFTVTAYIIGKQF
jgi:hypothetical protein